MRWCLASLSALLSSSHRASVVKQAANRLNIFEEACSTGIMTLAKDESSRVKAPFITFVLGGPGSGKGTQCAKIVDAFGFKHLSAGDLLRREISSNSENGTMILNTIKEGKIVPSSVTVKLIQNEICSSEGDKFLIDGFPRSEENRIAFEKIIGVEPNAVLFFDCPEDEMVRRVLCRNQGRVDDNVDTVKKRLKVFAALNLPVINFYAEKGKLQKINAVGTVDEVFERIRPVFAVYEFAFLLELSWNCASGSQSIETSRQTLFSTQRFTLNLVETSNN